MVKDASIPMKQSYTEPLDLNVVIDWLISQDHKVIRPFIPRMSYCESPPPSNLLKAAILDTETTGINLTTDKIIELGIVIVEYCPNTGQVYRVVETYNELEDPGIPIPAEATKVHGISDTMVKGKRILSSEIEKLIENVSLIIAHNAAFDRGFIEARFPFFKDKAWACSLVQIPWKNEGFGSASLEFLAYRFGFHFNGHRASTDCHALLEVLQSELPISKIKAFKTLIDQMAVPNLKLWALHAPFENKDLLKNRGYRWESERKTWYKTITDEYLPQETEWLKSAIYNNLKFQLRQETIDAYNRFSMRQGITEIVKY